MRSLVVLGASIALACAAANSAAGELEMLRLTNEAVSLPSNEQAKKIELYTKAIEEYRDYYLPWTNRAVCRLNYAMWDEAIADATEAIRLAPSNPHAYGVRGRAYAGKRQFEQAFRDLNRALELAETDEDMRNLYNDRGNAYFSARKYDDAVRDYLQAVQIDPTFAKGYNNLGIAYRSTGDYDRAIANLDLAVKYDAHSARALANRARVYLARNDPVMAKADLDLAVELDAKDASVLMQRGMYHYLMLDMQKARADFATALQLDPGNPYAAIWRFLSQASLGLTDDARVQLEAYLRDQKDQELWPTPVARMLLGKLDPQTLIADVAAMQDEARRRERLSEAHYYASQHYLLLGDQAKSKEQLALAAEQSAPRTPEYILASLTLSGWKPPQPPPPRPVPSESDLKLR